MFQWSDEHQMIRDAVKRFVDDEIRPHVDELEHEEPCPVSPPDGVERSNGVRVLDPP